MGWRTAKSTQSEQTARVTKTRFAQRGGSPGLLPSIQVSPTARQLVPGLGLTAPTPVRVVPSMSQIETWPLVFWNRMSEPPSVPIACQLGPGLRHTAPPPIRPEF
jgi:hypothetical protein